jgi:hypothetical protein
MKEKRLLGLVLPILAILANNLFALPAPEGCGAERAKLRKIPGVEVLFDQTCRTVYVMPPERGTITVNQIHTGANMVFCPLLESLSKTAQASSGALDKMSIGDKTGGGDDEFSKKIADTQSQIAALESRIADGRRQLAEENQKKSKLEQELKTDKVALEQCQAKNPTNEAECASIAKLYKEKSERLDRLIYVDIRGIDIYRESYEDEIAMLVRRIERIRGDADFAHRRSSQIAERMNTYQKSATAMFNDYARMEGPTMSIRYQTNWSAAVEMMARMNQGLGLHFEPLQILASTIAVTGNSEVINKSSGNVEIPIVQRFSLAEFSLQERIAKEAYGRGTISITLPETDLERRILKNSSIGNMSGQIVLSLFSGCQRFSKDSGTQKLPDDLRAHLGIAQYYDYPISVTRNYKASYNVSRLMTKLDQLKKMNFLIYTSDIRKEMIDLDSRSWFKISFEENSRDYSYSLEQIAQIKREVQLSLLSRALDQIAMPAASAKLEVAANRKDQQSNSDCPSDIKLCMLTSYLITLPSKIAGFSDSTHEIKYAERNWATEEVRGKKVAIRSSKITFDQ